MPGISDQPPPSYGNQTEGGTNFQLTGVVTPLSERSTAEGTATGGATPQSTAGFDDGDTIASLLTSLGLTSAFITQTASNPALFPPADGSDTTPSAPTQMTQSQEGEVTNQFDKTFATKLLTAMNTASPPLTAAQQQSLAAAMGQPTLAKTLSAIAALPPGDPEVAMFQQAYAASTLVMQAQYGLPTNWTPTTPLSDPSSTKPDSNWTPVATPSSYSDAAQATILADDTVALQGEVNDAILTADPQLTPAQVTMLQNAASSGSLPEGFPGTYPEGMSQQAAQDVSDIFYAATAQATINTQSEFNLPGTWLSTTPPTLTDPSQLPQWSPVSASSVGAPIPTALTNVTLLTNNAQAIIKQTQDAAQSVLNSLPPGSSGAVLIADFLKAIATAIDQLKAALQQMQARDAQLQEGLNAAQASELGGQRALAAGRQGLDDQQYQDAVKQRDTSNKTASIMKILGPVCAAIMMVVGALLAPAGVGLIILAIGAAMLAYSIADSECNLTAQMCKAISKFVGSLNPSMKALFLATIGAAVAVLIIGIAIVQPGAALDIGMDVGVAATTQAAQEVIVQFTVMTLMGTGVIDDTIGKIAKDCGANPTEIMVLDAIAVIVIVMCASAKSAIKNAGGITSVAKATAVSAKQAFQNFADALAQTFTKDLGTIVKEQLKNMGSSLVQIGKDMGSGLLHIGNDAWDILASLKGNRNFYTAIAKAWRSEAGAAAELQEAAGPFLKTVRTCSEIAPQAVQIYGGIIQGMVLLDLAKVLKEIGDNQASEQILQQLIQMLQKLLNKISDGMSDPSSEIGQLTTFVMSLFDKANAALGALVNSTPG